VVPLGGIIWAGTSTVKSLSPTAVARKRHDGCLEVPWESGNTDTNMCLLLLLLFFECRLEASTLRVQQMAAHRAASQQAPSTFRALHPSEAADARHMSNRSSSGCNEADETAVGGMGFMLPAGQIFL
jgi:hypothetical protein